MVNRVAHAITEAALDTLATGVVNFKRFKKVSCIMCDALLQHMLKGS